MVSLIAPGFIKIFISGEGWGLTATTETSSITAVTVPVNAFICFPLQANRFAWQTLLSFLCPIETDSSLHFGNYIKHANSQSTTFFMLILTFIVAFSGVKLKIPISTVNVFLH
jgi:hypothetical protein